MATKKAEEQQADHVNQSDEVRITPSQQSPLVICSDNHLEAGAIQGANIVNSTLNNTVIKIKQRRQGETVEELAL